MGFLSNLFGGLSDFEAQLVETYTLIYSQTGLSPSEAKSSAKEMMKKAKANARALGRQNLPPNLGDALLQGNEAVPGLFACLDQARCDGATDDDIRQWWNMTEIERQMVILHDNTNRMGVFVVSMQQGMMPDEAARQVRKTFPMFGNPDDTSNSSGEDRPLPFELKDRVNRWVERMARKESEAFKQRMEVGTSVNAVVRAAIRAGEL